jgi:broad specificity polyphosphatase/5'/3'-nucleotidase SurE
MKFVKIFIAMIMLISVVAGAAYFVLNSDQMQFESVCKKGNKRNTKLCNDVGKNAWTKKSVLQINENNYGKIIGVAWRKKDSIISSRNQKTKRKSEGNSYYYIVGDKKDADSQFLMLTSEIDPR